MPEFEFRVLCQSRGQICNHVKDIMREDFRGVAPVSSSKSYDHIGKIDLPSASDAISLKRRLKRDLGQDIKSIEIARV